MKFDASSTTVQAVGNNSLRSVMESRPPYALVWLALLACSSIVHAGVSVIQNLSPGDTIWPGEPVISTIANPSSATGAESFNGSGGNTNISQTFTVISDFTLRALSIQVGSTGTGTGPGTNITLNLYDLGTGQTGPNPSNYTASITGDNLFGSGAGLPISYSTQPASILEFDFTDADQVQLQAGHMYVFELTGVAGTTPVFWQRAGSSTYGGGAAYRNRSWNTGFGGNTRDFAMAVYTNYPPPPPSSEPGGATVNWDDVHQRIDGFGASSAWRNSGFTLPQYYLFFSTNRGIGLSLLRNRVSPEGSTTELAIMQAAKTLGGTRIWSATWSPPTAYKDSGTVNGGNFVSSPANYQGYASQLANYVLNMKNNGINLHAISIQNEPDANVTSYEACKWTAQQFHDFIPYLHSALESNGVSSTRIMIAESQNWNFSLASTTMNDPVTADMVGVLAAHSYGSSALVVNNYGKPLWETEVANLGSGAFNASIEDGINWARQIHSYLTVAEANAWHFWWLLPSSNNNEGLMDQAGVTPAKRLFTIGNYSRFVRPDYYRIGVITNSGAALVSAYKDSGSPGFAIVAINPGGLPIDQTFVLTNFVTDSVTPWITSATLNSTNSLLPIPVTSSYFNYTLPAMSVVTFVGQGVTTPPTLGIIRQEEHMLIFWPTNTAGFSLEYSTSLPPSNWTSTLPLPTIIGDQNVVTNSMTNGTALYRLNKLQ